MEEKVEEARQEAEEEKVLGEVVVRYNHYKERFPTVNGVLSFQPVEERYSFGDVFMGNFQPVLKEHPSLQPVPPITTGPAVENSWAVEEGREYRLEIIEDDDAEAQREKVIYKAPKE